MNKNKAFTLVELSVVICIFIMMIIFLTPVVAIIKERAHTINCANNLRKISLGLHIYAADHSDAFPASLGELYPNYVKDERAFDCPASKGVGTPEKPDYNYTAGLTEISPESEVIAYDLDDNHKGRTRTILRINGSVEWVSKGGGKPR